MLDNNSLVTNRILVSGEGIHKTYEESFFKCLSSSEFARYFGNSVSGLFKNTNGEIEVSYCYGGYETAINNTDLKKVEVLNIALSKSIVAFSCTFSIWGIAFVFFVRLEVKCPYSNKCVK